MIIFINRFSLIAFHYFYLMLQVADHLNYFINFEACQIV